MPTYEYLCSSCANQWEEVQRISEPALEVCPKCKKHTAKRQISAGNFILKGGGWYSDLYSSPKPGSKTEGAASSEPAKASGDTAGAGKTESSAPKESSAPAAKAESAATKAASSTSGGKST
jgi:putative FmdB family regulatory protein